ncbi:hypothetical protein SLS58_008648 [Diplodia intermedia]|uniref:Uncharacterized protein n=1 Tax=Diplodia intermedia TaxID=856260 RepID=A0ABR3TGT0_9PEZI
MSKEQEQRTASPQNEQRLGRDADSEKLKPGTGRAKGHERQSSLSPARSAHFAPTAVDISTGVKHQPPPRSISPAKSALKHSPSSSIRTGSPVAPHATGRAQSDISSDAGSYDGYKPSPRKKKGVRVSFEENITREEDSPSSPSSPAGLESSRWSGRTLQGMDDDLDDIMKPRPELPSFGSIRRERRPVGEEIAEKVTETIPSMSNSTSTMAEPLEASSDHAVGGVFARDLENKRRAKDGNDPLAPEVTSVHGTGYDSDDTASSMDESETASNHESTANGVGNGGNNLPAIPEKKSAEASPALDVPPVPQIAVQPATPGTDAENQEPPFEMPGGWSDLDDGSGDESLAATTASLASQEHSDTTDPAYGGQFQVFSAKDLQPVMSHQSSMDRYLNHSADEGSDDDSENSSIYSDAAEDLSELEGGFASLDAMVESPVIRPPSEIGSASPPESPIADKQEQQLSHLEEKPTATPSPIDTKRVEQPDKPVSGKPKSKPKATAKAAALEYDAAPILKAPKPKKKATVVPEPVLILDAAEYAFWTITEISRACCCCPNSASSSAYRGCCTPVLETEYSVIVPDRLPLRQTETDDQQPRGLIPHFADTRFSKGKASDKDSPKLGSSRFQSRYEDSSDDEDGGRLPTFRSRFADSDDEDDVTEVPSGLRPVRGIPRRADDDGDSTELEDELSDTEGPSSPPQKAKGAAVATNGNTNGATAELKSSLREGKSATDVPVSPIRKEKRGFFGLGKKRRDSADVPPKTPPETAAPGAASSPRAKLQRRDSHGRRTSESWPLPPAIPDEDPSTAAGRPTTSDGSPTKPRLSKRQSTGGETAESEPAGNVAIGRSGKKKKFPMLRKAFRLKD